MCMCNMTLCEQRAKNRLNLLVTTSSSPPDLQRSQNVKTNLVEFCRNTTIPGFNYLTRDASTLRALWSLVILVGFSLCGLFISNSLEEYGMSKVITTVQQAALPVTEIQERVFL